MLPLWNCWEDEEFALAPGGAPAAGVAVEAGGPSVVCDRLGATGCCWEDCMVDDDG